MFRVPSFTGERESIAAPLTASSQHVSSLPACPANCPANAAAVYVCTVTVKHLCTLTARCCVPASCSPMISYSAWCNIVRDGDNTLDNVFKILWPKYMMYFLYFNKKIQNTLFTENYYIIQTSRTNESQISHIKLFDQLFSSCC